MREIKFRAWIINQKLMYPVRLLHCGNGLHELIEDDGHCFNVLDKYVKIMQFTGLKDKNEKEIFEGDIVKYVGNQMWHRSEVKIEFGKFIPWAQDPKFCEIIGNIYSNQELLEGKP